jgi:hypothetical protein
MKQPPTSDTSFSAGAKLFLVVASVVAFFLLKDCTLMR